MDMKLRKMLVSQENNKVVAMLCNLLDVFDIEHI